MGIESLDRVTTDAAPDPLAKREEKSFSRWESKQQAFHYGFLTIFWVGVGIITIVFVARALHWVLPAGYCWMTEEQIKAVEGFLFHGLIGGFIATIGKKFLSDSAKDV